MLLFLAFIFPVAIYCLLLGVINRRVRPLMVSGPWDFAGVLFAASGFLLFVGPEVLASLYERREYAWLLGQTERPSTAGNYIWLAAWYLYYVAVVGAAIYMLRRRRSITAVYNVNESALEVALARVLERLGLPWRRSGNHYFLKPETASPGVAPAVVLELETFPSLCHATLRWHAADEPLRQEIERELAKVMEGMPTGDNPATSWFLWTGTALLFTILVGIAYIIVINWNWRMLHR